MTLLERLTSFIFSEPEAAIEEKEEAVEEPILTKQGEEENYVEILENLRFDGRDYKSLYIRLLRYFVLKPRSEPFSPYERKLIKEVVDSVTEKGESLVRLKTTSILKRKRPVPKAISKISFEKKAELEEKPSGEGKIQLEKIAKEPEFPVELPEQEIRPPIVAQKSIYYSKKRTKSKDI